LCRETNWHRFDYIPCGSSITRTECITDLGVLIDTKLHIHKRVDIFSQTIIRQLGLIRTVTFSFSSLHRLLTLYCMRSSRTQVGICLCCVEFYHFGVCKPERIQRRFVSRWHYRFFRHLDYSYGNVSNYLKLHTLVLGGVTPLFKECFQYKVKQPTTSTSVFCF